MTEPPLTNSPPTKEPYRRLNASPSRRALPASGMRSATILTIISAIVFAVAMWKTLRGNLSETMAEVAAGVALLTFGLLIYGLLQMILSLIESAGDRRQKEREATERRKQQRDGNISDRL